MHVKRVFDAYGPQRSYWGTDLTNSYAKASYRQRISHFTEELSFLTDSDKDLGDGPRDHPAAEVDVNDLAGDFKWCRLRARMSGSPRTQLSVSAATMLLRKIYADEISYLHILTILNLNHIIVRCTNLRTRPIREGDGRTPMRREFFKRRYNMSRKIVLLAARQPLFSAPPPPLSRLLTRSPSRSTSRSRLATRAETVWPAEHLLSRPTLRRETMTLVYWLTRCAEMVLGRSQRRS